MPYVFAMGRLVRPRPLLPFPVCLPKSPFSIFQSSLWLGSCFQAEAVKANKEHVPADPPAPSEGNAGQAAAPGHSCLQAGRAVGPQLEGAPGAPVLSITIQPLPSGSQFPLSAFPQAPAVQPPNMLTLLQPLPSTPIHRILEFLMFLYPQSGGFRSCVLRACLCGGHPDGQVCSVQG